MDRIGRSYEYLDTVGQNYVNRLGTPRCRADSRTDFADEIQTNAEAARRIVEQAASTIIGDADIETAHSVLDNRDELTADLEELERELHERDIPESHLIALTLDSLMRTAEYGGNIAEAALQTAARERQL